MFLNFTTVSSISSHVCIVSDTVYSKPLDRDIIFPISILFNKSSRSICLAPLYVSIFF